MSPTDVSADWIGDRPTLQTWLAGVPVGAAVGVDTEFMRRDTFHPRLALLQIGCHGRHALIDPLAFAIDDALQPTLGNRATATIIHSAGEDLETLAPLLPDGPGTLFDTQIAAAYAGMGLGVSYRALVAELCGVDLDKGETRSDWLQRPLTDSQRRYAALDVVYLEPIHDQLTERLQARGRAAWFAEDCDRLRQRASHRGGDLQPQRAMHGAAEWPAAQQARLRRILLWRDHTARTLDRPRPWLLDDALAMSIAHEPPTSLADLEQRSRGQRALRSPQRSELFQLLGDPVTDEEIASTTPIAAHPQGEAKKALQAMKTLIDTEATALDLPSGLLCARKVLEAYVATRTWPSALTGWREPVLRERLSALLPA